MDLKVEVGILKNVSNAKLVTGKGNLGDRAVWNHTIKALPVTCTKRGMTFMASILTFLIPPVDPCTGLWYHTCESTVDTCIGGYEKK